jgi:hypothetical protein
MAGTALGLAVALVRDALATSQQGRKDTAASGSLYGFSGRLNSQNRHCFYSLIENVVRFVAKNMRQHAKSSAARLKANGVPKLLSS